MCQTMPTDVCDEDELRTGRRREGIYGATYALAEKISIAIGIGAGGFLASACGYLSGVPSLETLSRLKAAMIVTPTVGILLGAAIIWRYPLSHERMREIRAVPDSRTITQPT